MYNVAYCFDKNFIQHFCAAVTSVILNFSKSPSELHFHLVVDKANEPLSKFVQKMSLLFGSRFSIYVVTGNEVAALNRIPIALRNMNYSRIAAYFRLLLPLLLSSNIEKVLYLDADTICVNDLSLLIDQELGHEALGMVLDPKSDKFAKHHNISQYFNSGVALFNLKQWRDEDLSSKCFAYLEKPTTAVALADQCAINVVLNGRIRKLDARWNRFTYHLVPEKETSLIEIRKEGAIIHFNSKHKPWHSWYQNDLGKLYWMYLEISPWTNPHLVQPTTVNEHVWLARKLHAESKYAAANEIYEKVVAHLLSKT